MTRLQITLYALLAPVLATVLMGGKPAADPAGTVFTFEPATVQLKTRAWQTPKAVDQVLEPVSLEVSEGETFSLLLDDGATLTGRWTRKSPKAKTLELQLDEGGQAALLESLGQRVADQLLPAWAQTGPADVSLLKLKARVRLVTDKQTGAVTAKLLLRVKVEGSIQPEGPDELPLKAAAKIVGLSVPVELG